jgi:hypothetical protein
MTPIVANTPFGHNPEELDRTNRNEYTRPIQERRKQVGHMEPGGSRFRNASGGIGQQQQSIECAPNANQGPSCLIGEQSE